MPCQQDAAVVPGETAWVPVNIRLINAFENRSMLVAGSDTRVATRSEPFAMTASPRPGFSIGLSGF